MRALVFPENWKVELVEVDIPKPNKEKMNANTEFALFNTKLSL